MTKTKTFSSVWDAIADTPEQAANLQARAELMRQIAAIIKAKNWKQADATAHCGVTQPRIPACPLFSHALRLPLWRNRRVASLISRRPSFVSCRISRLI